MTYLLAYLRSFVVAIAFLALASCDACNDKKKKGQSINNWLSAEVCGKPEVQDMSARIKNSRIAKSGMIRYSDLEDMSDEFELGRRLGGGAFGTTYSAVRKADKTKVAIKQQWIDSEDSIAMLSNEIESLNISAKNKCDDVMELYGVFYDSQHSSVFFSMELIEGENLAELVEVQSPLSEMSDGLQEVFEERQTTQDWRRTKIPESLVENKKEGEKNEKTFRNYWRTQQEFIEQVVNPIVRGTQCLHSQKIAHRDIKPDNIMYDSKSHTVTIVDLGISCIDECQHPFIGTPIYMPPESQLQEKYKESMTKTFGTSIDSVDGKDLAVGQDADIWGVGATLYEVLTGKSMPYPDVHEGEIIKVDFEKLPSDFDKVNSFIKKLLNPNYEERRDSWKQSTNPNGLIVMKEAS